MNTKHPDHFYTLKGYSLLDHQQITSSMEDYLEMICRLQQNHQIIRIHMLAEYLHVKPSSASKMVSNLRIQDLVISEKYGYVTPTEKGIRLGEYLLYRHNILNSFFCYLNKSTNELEQTEKVEHFIDHRTLINLKAFLDIHAP